AAARAVLLHVAHLAMPARVEPGQEAPLVLRQFHAGDAELLETQLPAPVFDLGGEGVEVGSAGHIYIMPACRPCLKTFSPSPRCGSSSDAPWRMPASRRPRSCNGRAKQPGSNSGSSGLEPRISWCCAAPAAMRATVMCWPRARFRRSNG